MITQQELIDHARQRSITNRGHAEQDYLQDIILHTISQHTGRQLVFKGGTALAKLYGLDRFSEDLDFTATATIDTDTLMDHVSNELDRYSATNTHETVQQQGKGIHRRFKIQGPLHEGSERSLCSIHIDINPRSTVNDRETRRLHPPYPDIPSFHLSTLPREEIAAEKVRAILTRDQPRDIYDLHFLLQQNIQPSTDLINDKLQYYDTTWDPETFTDTLRRREQQWGAHLPQLVHGPLPDYKDIISFIMDAFTENRSH